MHDHTARQQRAEELQRAVLAILRRHVGGSDAIKAAEIAGALSLTGRYRDRPVREAIRLLRQDGHLILSSVKRPYGYFFAASLEEWLEHAERNLRPRAMDMLVTLKAMTEAAQRRFGVEAGQVVQMELGL